MNVIETFRDCVLPEHCDDMGHLTVKEYYGFFGQASWALLSLLGYDKSATSTAGLGFADRRHELEFRRELRAGESFTIRSEVVRLGNSSITLRHRLLGGDGGICAELVVVTVQFDLGARRSVPLQAKIRDAAAARLVPQADA